MTDPTRKPLGTAAAIAMAGSCILGIAAGPIIALLLHWRTLDPPLPVKAPPAPVKSLKLLQAAPTPSVLRVGANLGGLTMGYLSPYANLMKTAGPWQGDPVNHGSFVFDSNGWIKFSAFPTNKDTKALQVISYVRSCQDIPSNDQGAPCCPSGTYSLTYTANEVCPAGSIVLQSATASFTVSALSSVTASNGRTTATYACSWTPNPLYTGAAFMVVVNGSRLGPAPTDIAIYPPGISPIDPPEFDPNYLRQMAPFRHLRTVVVWDLGGWTQPSDTPAESVRSYATVEGRTGITGMPVPSFVRLVSQIGMPGNPCGVDLCIPWGATKELTQYLGQEFRKLPAGSDVRVEYGNESWNSANGPQWNHVLMVGAAGPPYPDQSPTYAHPGDAFSGAAIESTRVWNDFAKTYGNSFLKVMSSQQGSPQPCINHMQAILAQNLTKPDRWAVSWYVPLSVPPTKPGPYTLSQIQDAQALAARQVTEGFATHRKWLDTFNVDGKTTPFSGTKLLGYEGGFTHSYLTQTLSGQQSRENLAWWAHPFSQGLATWVLNACADPALGVDVLDWYATDYVIPIEAGVYPLYALYLSPDHYPGANDGTGGTPDLSSVLSLAKPDSTGSMIGQVPLDQCGSPQALALLKWSLAHDTNPVPVPVPVDPWAAQRAKAIQQATELINQTFDSLPVPAGK